MGRAMRGGGGTAGSRAVFVRVAKLAGLAVLTVPLMTGCTVVDAVGFGWPDGITPQAHQMRLMWTGAAIAALSVGIITWAAMFWAITFHRKKKTDDEVPPRQTQYNMPLEIVFTVIPTIIVVVLFSFTVLVQNYVIRHDPNPAVKVDVVAFQWNWKFSYPDQVAADGKAVETVGTATEVPLLVLPTDRSVQFTLRANDVIHSFFVPEFLFKRDVFPMPEKNDQDNVFSIDRIERPGAFIGRCAELCGTYHATMNFEVRALPPAAYDRYIALRKTINPATGFVYTTAEALTATNCGQWCAPTAITTVPFTSRGELAAKAASATING